MWHESYGIPLIKKKKWNQLFRVFYLLNLKKFHRIYHKLILLINHLDQHFSKKKIKDLSTLIYIILLDKKQEEKLITI